MNCHVLHMSWLFACACSHCTPSTRSQTHPKTIAKCIEKSFYMPWRRHSFLHLLCCKNMKNKKNVNNYPRSQTHPVSLPLSVSLFDIYDVLSAQEIHTPWSRDAYLGSRYPLKHSSLPSCLWLSNQARNVCVWWVRVCTYMKKQQCVALFVLCTDCQSINNASLRKRFSPGKKIRISFFPGLKAFWIHLTCFCLWVKLF